MPNAPTEAQQRHRFTKETASAAGKKSATTRRTKAAARAALPAELARKLADVRQSFADVDLAASVVAVAGIVMARLASGEIPVRNGGEAADLLRALHEIARLEAGQPTSLSATVSIPPEVAMARLHTLQQQARATMAALPSATAQAADDEEVHDPPAPVAVVMAEDPAPPAVETPVPLEGSTPHPR
jgi:hypothetical protein